MALVQKQVSSRGKPLSRPRRIGYRDNAVRFSTPRIPPLPRPCLNPTPPFLPTFNAYTVTTGVTNTFSLSPNFPFLSLFCFILLYVTLALYKQGSLVFDDIFEVRGGRGKKGTETLKISNMISMGFYSAKPLVFPSLDKLHFIAFNNLVLFGETNECTR